MNIKEDNLFILYNNYLHALLYQNEFKDKYGDTKEIIQMYEKKLIKVLKKESSTMT